MFSTWLTCWHGWQVVDDLSLSGQVKVLGDAIWNLRDSRSKPLKEASGEPYVLIWVIETLNECGYKIVRVGGPVFALEFTPDKVEVYDEPKFKVGDNVIYSGILSSRNGKSFTVINVNGNMQFPYTIQGKVPSHAVEVYEHEITLDLTTPKFKVGQRVTLNYTTDPNSMWFGNGTVVAYDGGYSVRTDAGERGWFQPNQVKEFVPAPSRFKVGDRVKAAQSPAINESHGKFGTVTEINRQVNTDKITGEPGITVKWDGTSFGYGYKPTSVEKFSNAEILKSLKVGAVIQFDDELGRWTKSSVKNPKSSTRDYGTFHSNTLGDGYPLLLSTEGWKITVLSEGTDK